jgi:TonB family protein
VDDSNAFKLWFHLERELPLLVAVKCVQAANRTMTIKGKVLAGAALLIALGSGAAWHVAASSQPVAKFHPPLAQWERNLRRMPAHISEFVPVSEPLALSICGDVRPPEALLTPDPMLPVQDEGPHVRVSFIVGSDGHVYSPFILESGGPEKDQMILSAVRRWRYRPALCNGIPTDSEARVRFAAR